MTPSPASSSLSSPVPSPVSNPVAQTAGGPAAVVGSATPPHFAKELAQHRARNTSNTGTPPSAPPPARASAASAAGAAQAEAGADTGAAAADHSDRAVAGETSRDDEEAGTAPAVDALLSRLAAAEALPSAEHGRAASGPSPAPAGAAVAEGVADVLAAARGGTAGETPGLAAPYGGPVAAALPTGHAGAAAAAGREADLAAHAASSAGALAAAGPAAGAVEDTRALQAGASADKADPASTHTPGLNGGPSGAHTLAAATALSAPAAAPLGSAAAPLPEARLPAAPGHADFAPQLGAQVSLFVREGVHQARLQLNPAEMGPITVQIRLEGGAAQVHLAAENALTRQALEQALPTLAGSLRESGLTLTGGGVFEQPGQAGQGAAGEPGQGRPGQAGRGRGDTDLPPLQDLPGGLSGTSRSRGVVDLVA